MEMPEDAGHFLPNYYQANFETYIKPVSKRRPNYVKRSELDLSTAVFVEFKAANSATDKLWACFLREVNGHLAKCRICEKILSCTDGSTTGLRSHATRVHKIVLDTAGPSGN